MGHSLEKLKHTFIMAIKKTMVKNDENKNKFQDFPGGPVVKNPPADVGDSGSIPGWGTKIPYALGKLSSHTAITP